MIISTPNFSAPSLEIRVQPGLEVVERRLREAVSGSRGLMDQLASYLALAGGKRLRPVLTLVCAQLGNPARALNEAVITGATAVELTHLASLYHDDIMGSASVRRGVPSTQHLRGNNRTILAGNVLFTRVSMFIAALDPRMVSRHARAFKRLCIGQLNETFGSGEGQGRVDFYIRILTDKMGPLAATTAHFGAWLSGADEEVAAIVSEFNKRISAAFRIVDGVIDLASNDDTFGKTPDTGLCEGVGTLPVLLFKRRLAQGMINENGRRILEALDSDLSSDEALAKLVTVLHRHEVLEETCQMTEDWSMHATKTLEPLPEGEVEAALTAFTHLMVDRLA